MGQDGICKTPDHVAARRIVGVPRDMEPGEQKLLASKCLEISIRQNRLRHFFYAQYHFVTSVNTAQRVTPVTPVFTFNRLGCAAIEQKIDINPLLQTYVLQWSAFIYLSVHVKSFTPPPQMLLSNCQRLAFCQMQQQI